MSKIRFIKSLAQKNAEIKWLSSTIVDLTFNEKPDDVELLGGFEILNEYNNTVMGRIEGFNTFYRVFDDFHVQLSNDGSVYVDPEPEVVEPVVEPKDITITFVGTDNLTLSFYSLIVKEGTNLSDIDFPFVTSKVEDYGFDRWSETSGKIYEDTFIYAYEKYIQIYTLQEIRNTKIAELAKICEQAIVNGVDVEIRGKQEHFSYTVEDQANIDDLISMITTSGGMDQPYHADDKLCKLYTPTQLISIYAAAKINKTHHITYFNSLKAYLLTLEDVDAIEAVTYGQDLEGEYLKNYNAMMDQAKAITNAVLASMSASLNKTIEIS